MTQLLAAALRYAAAGWPVFPCAPGAKVPLYSNPHAKGSPERTGCRGECGQYGHGLLDATTDPAIVTAWWTRTPTANVGLATGAPGPDVLDVDTKHSAPGAASSTRLRDAGLIAGATAVVVTPSGGWHLYYRGTGQGNSTRPRHGIDFRGRGGYVLAPPSTVDGHGYVLTEHRPPTGVTVDWRAIRDFLDPPPPSRPVVPGCPSGGFDALVRWLEDRPAGDRNNALYWATRRALEGGAGDEVLDQLHDAIVRAGHDPTDADRTIQSARRSTQRRTGTTR